MKAWRYVERLVIIVLLVIPAICLAQNKGTPPDAAASAQSVTGGAAIDCGTFAASEPSLGLVSKLCGFALTYRSKLPDFIAQQTTTSNRPGGTVVITAQVTYHQGLEKYSRVMINGKPAVFKDPDRLDIPMFTSGEFGPLLINLFEVPGAVEFTFTKMETIQGTPVAVFAFHLPKEKNTFWEIRDSRGETRKPEFHGRLWLERQTGRLVREEVEPVLNAWQTGIISTKLTADYAMTKVRDLGTFLLPEKSESNICLMGRLGNQLGCTRNVAVFHDYQKFAASGRIVPGDSQQ